MSNNSNQRRPNHRDKLDGLKNRFNKFRAKSPSTQPSRTSTPDPLVQPTSSSMRGEAGGVRSLSKPEIIITPIGDSSEASGVAAISKDTADREFKSDKDEETGTILTPDWDLLKIDGDAITQLCEWGSAHENSNWRKLAEKINQTLNSKTIETLKAFIPNSPFPAKSLVNALLSLVQLGINVPLIQKQVYEVAHEAIEYISSLVEVAGEELSVNKELQDICVAVNDICQWAREHVSRMSLSADELEGWRTRFARAKETFLAKKLTKIRVEQVIASRVIFIEKKLASHVAAKYAHTDQSKSLCAEGTRVELLKEIEKWLSPQSFNAEHIFWVTGIPGSGKSTLSATIVDNLRKNHTPVSAQFFISRNIPETVDPNKIIPTIAQQLAISSPTAARVLEKTLKYGYPATRKEQVTSLLLDPVRELSKSCDVVVILIDALDELKDAAKSVVEILSYIAPIECDLPDNVRFVITSRPEHWADISRSKNLKHTVFKQYLLVTESSVSEVHSFIVARVKEIKPDEPDWEKWPPPVQLQKLSDKANGLFHYAATALQWIEQRIDEDGTACQQSAFERFSEEGLDELEGLYEVILTSWQDVNKPAKDKDRRDTRLRGFQHVMGTILVLRKPLTIRQIIALLSDIPKNEFDVAKFLQQMRSVLIPGTTTSFDDAMPQIHKSFRDYIMSDRAPPTFQILTGNAHFKIARSCLEVIVNAGRGHELDHSYAGEHWDHHLRQAVAKGAGCDDEKMWNLLGDMLEDQVVNVWGHRAWRDVEVFMNVAAAGWFFFQKYNAEGGELVVVSTILLKIKENNNDNNNLDNNWRWDLNDWRWDLNWRWRNDRDTPYRQIWEDGLMKVCNSRGPPGTHCEKKDAARDGAEDIYLLI